MLFVCSLIESCDAEKHYKIPVPSKQFSENIIILMHYERCESKKTSYMLYLQFTLLQQSVFGIIHVFWEILWTFENCRDTAVDSIVV